MSISPSIRLGSGGGATGLAFGLAGSADGAGVVASALGALALTTGSGTTGLTSVTTGAVAVTGSATAGLLVPFAVSAPVSFCCSAKLLFLTSRIFCSSLIFFSSCFTRALASAKAFSLAIRSSSFAPILPVLSLPVTAPAFDSFSLSFAPFAAVGCS